MTDPTETPAFREEITAHKERAFELLTHGLDPYHAYVFNEMRRSVPGSAEFQAANELIATEGALLGTLSSGSERGVAPPENLGDMIRALDRAAHPGSGGTLSNDEIIAKAASIAGKALSAVGKERWATRVGQPREPFTGFSYQTDFLKLRARVVRDAVQVNVVTRKPDVDAGSPLRFVIRSDAAEPISGRNSFEAGNALKTVIQSQGVRVHAKAHNYAILEGTREKVAAVVAHLPGTWSIEEKSAPPHRPAREGIEWALRSLRLRPVALTERTVAKGENVSFYLPVQEIGKLGEFATALRYQGFDVSKHEIESIISLVATRGR